MIYCRGSWTGLWMGFFLYWFGKLFLLLVFLSAFLQGLAFSVRVVDPMRNNCLLAHSHNVGAHEVQVQTSGKSNGDDRQEPGHDPHDHLLLGVDRSVRIATPCYLALLDIARHPDQHDQQQEGERGGKRISECISEAGRQIHAQKVHLCVVFERLPQF